MLSPGEGRLKQTMAQLGVRRVEDAAAMALSSVTGRVRWRASKASENKSKHGGQVRGNKQQWRQRATRLVALLVCQGQCGLGMR